MALLSIEGAKLSGIQVWAVIVTIPVTLGISALRENKAVSSTQQTTEAVIRQGIEIKHLQDGQNVIKDNAASHEEDFNAIMSELNDLKGRQKRTDENINEIINIGQFYIEHQKTLNEEQMKDVMDDWIKKNELRFHVPKIMYEPIDDD